LLLTKAGAAIGFALLAAGCVQRPESPPPSPFHSTDIRSVEWVAISISPITTDSPGTCAISGEGGGDVLRLHHCPDVCPTTIADMAQVLRKLGPSAAQVQELLVTVDPTARDTPEVLARYVTAFHPSFLGLRSDARTTENLAKEFKAFYAARPSGHEHHDYMVDHTRAIYVFDRQGKLTLLKGSGRSVDQRTVDIALLVRE
jgi:protein SCO1/2